MSGPLADGWYVLDVGVIRGPVSTAEWVRWHQANPDAKHIARTTLTGGVEVSTLFLDRDQRLRGEGPPILFETMIFEGEWNGYQQRYTSLATARAGHAAVVAALEAGLDPYDIDFAAVA